MQAQTKQKARRSLEQTLSDVAQLINREILKEKNDRRAIGIGSFGNAERLELLHGPFGQSGLIEDHRPLEAGQ
jgi:hypothetical protein